MKMTSSSYQIWHKDELIIDFDGTIKNARKLPFALRNNGDVNTWVNLRVDNLKRTYMNLLYIQKQLGRSTASVIVDSGAISITDLFWVQLEGTSHTWDSLQILRDESLEILDICLNGKVEENFVSEIKKYKISNFSLKGLFPKTVYNGYILKAGEDYIKEFYGYKLGKVFNISVQTVEKRENLCALKVFTDDKNSLVHALELIYGTYGEIDFNITHEEILNKFSNNINIYKQICKLYLFNYIISNIDFHGENFGFLYDSETFEIKSIAPAFDFNMAFDNYSAFNSINFYIASNLKKYINLVPEFLDIDLEKLKKLKKLLGDKNYKEITLRYNYLKGEIK